MASLLATRADVEALAPGVEDAVDDYSATLLDEYLELAAAGTEGDDVFWGGRGARAQALRCLHILSRTGVLTAAGYEDPGESGPVASRSSGAGNSTSFSTSVLAEDLGLTKWGRTLAELQRARLAVTLPSLTGTEY